MLKEITKKYGSLSGFLLFKIENSLKIKLPVESKTRWKASTGSEAEFWDRFFKGEGLGWKADYQKRLDPELPLQDDVVALLPEQNEYKVLDVGSGPLTVLGKKIPGKKLDLVLVDPLAKEYDAVMAKYGVKPVVRAQEAAAENLNQLFDENTFDLVYAQNCIDHSFSPEESILQMLKVVKPGHYVYMKHIQNEAIKENWYGLHQWNFSCSNGDFIIGSRHDKINFSQKHKDICTTHCYIDESVDWVIVQFRKK